MYNGIVSHSPPQKKNFKKMLVLTHFSCGVGIRVVLEREKKANLPKILVGGGRLSKSVLQTRERHSHMVQSNGPKASSPLPSEPPVGSVLILM